MSSKSRDLGAIQRWMQAVIAHPHGVAAGVESPEARLEIDLSPGDLTRIIAPSKAQSSLERLAVYGNAYYARLLECLRDEYPALVCAVGKEAFDGLAVGYLQQRPSTSYTLAELGAGFPAYLRETRPDSGQPRPSWTDFVIELAELERLYAEVFDGPGPEGRTLLQMDELLAIDSGDWPEARLVTVDWLHLRDFDFPVHQYATAVRRQKDDPAPPEAVPTWLAVTRRDYVVRRIPLSHPQYCLMSALARRQTIARSLAAAVDALPEGHAGLTPADIRRWFQDWSAAGFFQAVEAG